MLAKDVPVSVFEDVPKKKVFDEPKPVVSAPSANSKLFKLTMIQLEKVVKPKPEAKPKAFDPLSLFQEEDNDDFLFNASKKSTKATPVAKVEGKQK